MTKHTKPIDNLSQNIKTAAQNTPHDPKKWRIVLFSVIALAILAVVFVGAYHNYHHSQTKFHHPIARLEKKHAVTKALSNTKAVIYQPNDDPLEYNETLAALKSGAIKEITLLMYSDGCPLCNSHKQDLVNYVQKHVNSQHAIIAIDNGRDQISHLEKDFDIPTTFHYPAVLHYKDRRISNKANSQFAMNSMSELYR